MANCIRVFDIDTLDTEHHRPHVFHLSERAFDPAKRPRLNRIYSCKYPPLFVGIENTAESWRRCLSGGVSLAYPSLVEITTKKNPHSTVGNKAPAASMRSTGVSSPFV